MNRALLAPLVIAFVIAFATSARAQSWPDLHADAPAQGGGANDAALVVGVSDYVYLPRVDGANDNATAWQEWLVRTRKVPGDHVVLLRDREATKERIERNLRTLATQVGSQGTIWFVFIGHGAPSPSGDDGLLLGPDTDSDADSLVARGVAQRTVLDALEKSGAAHAVALFDACFSGMTSDGKEPLVKGLQATLPVRRTGPPSKTAVLASSETFAGPLPGAAKPAFSYLVLGALRGWGDSNADGAVTIDEAYALARGTMQTGFKSDARLPSKRGPSPTLAMNAKEPRPDLDAILLGRCPSGSSWNGRACVGDAPMICPSGARWNGTACVSVCPAGTSWNGTGCAVARVLCPDGSEWDGASCVAGVPPKVAALPPAHVPATVPDDHESEPALAMAVDEPPQIDARAVVAPAAAKPPLWLAAAAPAGGTLVGGLLLGLTSGFAIADIDNQNDDNEGFEPFKLSVGDAVFAGSDYDDTERRNKGGYVVVHSLVAVGGAAGGALGSWLAGGDAIDAAVIGGVSLAVGLATAVPTATVYNHNDLPPTVAASTASGLAIIAASAITGAALNTFRE